jgi:glycosyltransferase involved in cell wall biosynthesis
MKILVLTKRQYMGKDLLDDRFGRFWELPLELARRGHEVHGICLSYRKRPEGSVAPSIQCQPGNFKWHSMNLLNGCWPGPRRYFQLAGQTLRDFQPDIIWACSDAFHVIFGHGLAKSSTAKLVIDLYDNFESYLGTRIPGLLAFFKRALRGADAVTSVSRQLANHVADRYQCHAPALVLENAIRADLFFPMERDPCRKQLGLPQEATIIGTAGALHPSRGIDTLYRAFALLSAGDPQLHLALAGARPSRAGIPRGTHIHDFGVLPMERVSTFFNALDVSVICNRDSSFGRFNFTQKAREILACGTAVVAADVGSMKEILGDHRECLFAPSDPASLAAAVHRQLMKPARIRDKVPSWSDLATQLEAFFHTVRSRI